MNQKQAKIIHFLYLEGEDCSELAGRKFDEIRFALFIVVSVVNQVDVVEMLRHLLLSFIVPININCHWFFSSYFVFVSFIRTPYLQTIALLFLQ